MNMSTESLAPILSVEHVPDALAWYQRLGFRLEWEHSAGPGFSQTVAVVKRGAIHLILSNRQEDGRPGSVVIIGVSDVDAVAAEFNVESKPWFFGSQVELHDPGGNRIIVGPHLPTAGTVNPKSRQALKRKKGRNP